MAEGDDGTMKPSIPEPSTETKAYQDDRDGNIEKKPKVEEGDKEGSIGEGTALGEEMAKENADSQTLGTVHLTFAGAIMVTIAILGFLNPYFLIGSLGNQSIDNFMSTPKGYWDMICGLLSIVFSIICLIGAFGALIRRFKVMVYIGALLGGLTIGLCGLNLFLGLLAIGLAYKSNAEFR